MFQSAADMRIGSNSHMKDFLTSILLLKSCLREDKEDFGIFSALAHVCLMVFICHIQWKFYRTLDGKCHCFPEILSKTGERIVKSRWRARMDS
jgi:hypothetical protein